MRVDQNMSADRCSLPAAFIRSRARHLRDPDPSRAPLRPLPAIAGAAS
jgi:hypothetical protein